MLCSKLFLIENISQQNTMNMEGLSNKKVGFSQGLVRRKRLPVPNARMKSKDRTGCATVSVPTSPHHNPGTVLPTFNIKETLPQASLGLIPLTLLQL